MKTTYSRRDLYAAGEPLGDSATQVIAGRRIYGGGGGGANPAAAPQTQTETQAGVAEYAQPYVNTMLGATMQNVFNTDQSGNVTGMKGFTPYSYNPADYYAGFSPLQQQAQSGIAGLQNPWQTGAASGTLADAIQRASNLQYTPVGGGYSRVQAPQLQQYQMGPAERVGTQDFNTPGTAESYMSPYMQNVVQAQQREAQRASDIQKQANQAQAVQSGAFSGARRNIVEGQRQRDLATQMGNIQAQGLQNAFTQGQQQFNTQQQQALQAALANQQAGLTTGTQNLNALLGIQQLGAGQNLQAQQLNQAARQQAAQLRAQQQQFGANLGLQGLQAAMSGAGQLSGLGTTGLQNQLNILNAQNQAGAQQQAQQQQIINQAVQNYNTAQQYPYMQLGFMQNMLQGLPITTSSQQQYQAAPSTVSQLAGLGMAGLGLGQLSGLLGGRTGTTGTTTTGNNPVTGAVNSALGTGLTGLLNTAGQNISSGVSDAWSGIRSALGFAKGGKVPAAPAGLTALALSKMK